MDSRTQAFESAGAAAFGVHLAVVGIQSKGCLGSRCVLAVDAMLRTPNNATQRHARVLCSLPDGLIIDRSVPATHPSRHHDGQLGPCGVWSALGLVWGTH